MNCFGTRMTHSYTAKSGTARPEIESSLALNFVNQRNELLWLAYLLTGNRTLSVNAVTDAMDHKDVANPFFKNWMVSWARKLVIVKAHSEVEAELAASARRIRQRQFTAGWDVPQPVDWNLADSDKPQLERALLAIDFLPRWALVLTVFERVSIEEAANLLGVERDLLWFARAAGLKELACNLAREQGWTPALSVVSAGAVGAAVPLPL